MINVLLKHLRSETSTVDAVKVAMTGATELRDRFSSVEMQYILTAYMEGLKAAFLVAVVASSVATVVCLGMRWIKFSGQAAAAAVA